MGTFKEVSEKGQEGTSIAWKRISMMGWIHKLVQWAVRVFIRASCFLTLFVIIMM